MHQMNARPRRFALTVCALLLSVTALAGCQQSPPPPIPGQPMTWQQKFYQDQAKLHEDYDHNRQNP